MILAADPSLADAPMRLLPMGWDCVGVDVGGWLIVAAGDLLDAFAALGPDPHGEAFGHFDAHGWNMAWDGAGERLNGVYDFGDAGIGPLHGEFVAPSLVAPDLAARVIAAYERLTGRIVDRERVRVLTGAHRLWELAAEAGDPSPFTLRQAAAWIAAGPGVLTRPA